MKQPVKQLSHVTDNPRIEVLCYSSLREEIVPYSFYASNIDHIEKAGEKSIIVLLSGDVISLALPYEELTDLLDQGYSPLDLKPYYQTVPTIVANTAPGIKMPDGTIFAGISPDTGKPMYVAPEDASICMDFNAAALYAATLEVGRRKGFRVPSVNELKVLFNNRVAIGGFVPHLDSYAQGHYWSSIVSSAESADSLNFLDGKVHSGGYYKRRAFAVRCVRS